MTPQEFEQKYHETSVDYFSKEGFARSQIVNVHIYRQTSQDAQFPEKNRLVSQLKEEVRKAGGLPLIGVQESDKEMISRAFYGKGSPQDCATALRYALRYNHTQPEKLQNYCDQVAEIGLDCSGFVNCYFRAIRRISSDRSIEQYAQGTLRDAVSAIRAQDVLIWTNSSGNVLKWPHAHIALVDSAPDSNGRATIVEAASSMGGLTHSQYTITRTGHHVFQVNRPASKDPNKRTGYVKIAQVS